MRTPAETAAHMVTQYGNDAGVHCTYAIMNNEGAARDYWIKVRAEIAKLERK